MEARTVEVTALPRLADGRIMAEKTALMTEGEMNPNGMIVFAPLYFFKFILLYYTNGIVE